MPDFPKANQDPGVDRFLRKYGLRYEEVPVGDLEPTGLHLALGTSPRGGQHAVVEKDGKLVWDPHPQDGTGRGLKDVKAYGLLLPLKGRAEDAGRLPPLLGPSHYATKRAYLLRKMEHAEQDLKDTDQEHDAPYIYRRALLAYERAKKAYESVARDAAPLSGKRLHTAAEALRAKHDEIKENPDREGRFGAHETAYRSSYIPIAMLVAEAEALLAKAALDDDPVFWRGKLLKAKAALVAAKESARQHDYRTAAVYQDIALSLAHMVIDKMRNSGRARDSDDNVVAVYRGKKIIKARKGSIYKYQALLSDWDKYGANTIEGAKAGTDKYLGPKHKEATDSAKRQRLHRALDCVMDRSFGK